MNFSHILFTIPLLLGSSLAPCAEMKTVRESARQIPIAYEVDVAVVGGSAAGVAAAVEAAKTGARVFLAAPYPYLGEDLCATQRLWLEPGEEPDTPFTQAVFAEPKISAPVGKGIPFTYEADRPSAAVHRDTTPPSILSDGKGSNASSQSVQYNNDDVVIVADLGALRRVEKVHLLAYQRDGEFAVENASVAVSADKQNWSDSVTVQNPKYNQGGFEEKPIDLSAAVGREARYIRFAVKKGQDAKRILLAEIVVESDTPPQSEVKAYRIPPTPMQIKSALDKALLEAGVQFLYSCYATDVLFDEQGRPAGIAIVNRSGRQAVIAKTIIDALPRAELTRRIAEFEPYPSGSQTVKRVVVGGDERKDSAAPYRILPFKITVDSHEYAATEYTLSIPMSHDSFASFAQADQIARDRTWQSGQVNASEILFQVPPDPMKGKQRLEGDWPGASEVALDSFRPQAWDNWYALNGCADISRKAAEQLLRPLNLIAVGARMGKTAALQAKEAPKPQAANIPGKDANGSLAGEVRELLSGVRPTTEGAPTIPAGESWLPVLGEYDVVVIGGGTGGAPAGIAAARQGAKTLVVEYLHGLGGIGTLGLIGKYYYGYREGFTKEIDDGVIALGGARAEPRGGWNVEDKMEWYRRELRKAGADIWFGVLGAGAVTENGKITGVIVATPEGRGVILCRVAIDATGSADIAIAAGANYDFTGAEHAALQGTGLPPRQPGASYTNTDYTFVDDSDPVDVWQSFIIAKEKFAGAYDVGQIVDSRERRRVVGDFTISPLDIINHRTYPDTINIAYSNFDTHGYTVHPAFILKSPDKEGIYADTPYRALLPKELDGIIVTGLGISAHRDAMPILRMQPCIQNQGYAMGVAASIAVKDKKSLRDIDIKALQKHLIEKGNLPERVLTEVDSYPYPKEKIEEAVQKAANDYQDLPILLSQPETAIPLLRNAYRSADEIEKKVEDSTRTKLNPPTDNRQSPPKLIYAHILGMLSDPTGADALLEAVAPQPWDEGWRFTGMGQFGGSVSPLDTLIIALGRTRDPRALPVLLNKLKDLGSNDAFSHHRAMAMALESLRDPQAAKPLAELLGKPDMAGHAFTDIHKAIELTPKGYSNDNSTREKTLREIVLARALYRCGDYNGLGEKILRDYERDLRGHLARHAHAVLKEKP